MGNAAQRPKAKETRGSGRQGRTPEPRFLAVGQVVGAHGVRGELTVMILTDDPTRFGRLTRVYVGQEDEDPTPRRLEGFRLHRGRVLLKLEGCEDRDAAEALRGCLVQVPLEEAIPLSEGEYYEYQILGLAVWTTSGEALGEVAEILHTGANDVYIVQNRGSGRSEILIPAITDVIREVDLETGRLIVQLPPGLV